MSTRRHDTHAPVTSPGMVDIAQVAAELKLDFSEQERQLLFGSLETNLAILNELLVDTAPEAPGLGNERRISHRPSAADDRWNAWLSRCSITGRRYGLLAGRTVSFKDTIAVADVPLTCGVMEADEYVPDFDATIVRRALEQGATVVGKNTILGGFGEPSAGRRPLNPHSSHHLSGGTSSGSAVAVVAGEVDVAFGGDQGGSIRVPAAWCGAVGLKPTFGLVSNFGAVSGADQSVDHLGPIARSVEDAATALQAVAGYDPLDPRQRRGVPETMDVLSALQDGVAGVRIGLLTEGFIGATDDVARLVRRAARALRRAGAEVREVSIPEHRRTLAPFLALVAEGARLVARTGPVGSAARTLYPAGLVAALNKAWAGHAATAEKYSQFIGEVAWRLYGGKTYALAHNARPRFVEAYDRALRDVDVLLMPTCLFTAPRFKGPEPTALDFPTTVHRLGLTNTFPFNYTGHPALAVPCGKSKDLPVSLQLVGRSFEEALLLRVGYAFQKSVPYDEYTAAPGR